MSSIVETRAVEILRDPRFQLPRPWDGATPPLGEFLRVEFVGFCDLLGELEQLEGRFGRMIGYARAKAAELGSRIVAAAGHLMAGHGVSDARAEPLRASAREELDHGLRVLGDVFLSTSRRHSGKVMRGGCWYRLRARPEDRTRGEIFHVPFEKPQRHYRFSTPNVPTLYLANSVYLCWLECGEPCLDDGECYVARFEVSSQAEFLDLPCNHNAYLDPLVLATQLPADIGDPRLLDSSPYRHDVAHELAEYLSIWPLLATVSLPRTDPADEPVQYLFPQLLMEWVRESKFVGVRYFTTKQDPPETSQDWSVNLAIPTRTTKNVGFCDVLAKLAPLTEPQCFDIVISVDPSRWKSHDAIDRREERGGRLVLRRRGNRECYVDTVFGRMEYWLDRPKLDVRPVDL